MIVSCENCHTRFKLGNERLRTAGVKLRCSKCQHTFELKPLPPADAAPEASVSSDPPAAPGTHPQDEVVIGALPGTEPGARLDDDRIDLAVDAALRMPEGPVAAEMNQSLDGERSGRVEDLFGAPGDAAAEGLSPDPDLAAASPASGPRERSEDFDWDHLSFSESRPASVDEALKATEEAGGPPESESLELDTGRSKSAPGRDAFPKSFPETARETGGGADSQLELARPAPFQGGPSQGSGEALKRRPSPREELPAATPVSGGARGVAGGSEAQRVEKRVKQPEPAARIPKVSAAVPGRSLSLPSQMAVRPKRPPLLLPLVPTLAGSMAIGLLVALASAFSIYASDGPLARTASVLHPGGAAGGQAALLLDDLSGRRVGRQGVAPLYVVTGRARWSAPPKGNWVLDGVLVDRRGRALQRRGAQIGPLSMLSGAPEATSGDPGPGTPLPARGETRFLIRFSPQPAWEAGVRLEVRPAD